MKINTKTPYSKDKFTGVTIGDEWTGGEDNPIPICSYCSITLVRLSAGDKNESWFCRHCSIEYPDVKETRKKNKLGIQKKEVEPAITSVGNTPDVSISMNQL